MGELDRSCDHSKPLQVSRNPFQGYNTNTNDPSNYICPKALAQHYEHVASSRAYSPSARFTNNSYASSDGIGLQGRRQDSSRGYIGIAYSESQSDLPLLRSSGGRYPSILPPNHPGGTMSSRLFGTKTPRPSSKTMISKGSRTVLDLTKGPSEESSISDDTEALPIPSIKSKKPKKKKWLIIGFFLALVGLIIVGAVTGVLLKKNNSPKTLATQGNKGASKQTDPNDPSTFIRDPDLHQAFYGIAYTPQNSQLPNCGNSLQEVITDIQLLSQLTRRIRLYGADCNQTALVLDAIRQTKVDMQVWLGNYPIATDNGAAYERQRDIIRDAITTYGTDHIGGVTVGNEFMLNYLTAHGSNDPNSVIASQGAEILIANIQDTRSMLASMNLPNTLQVGNSDAGNYFNNRVLAAVDYGLANVHPWFANVSIDASAEWTSNFFQTVNVNQANALSNKPKMYIAETGWPSKSSDAAHATDGPSAASIGNVQKYLDTFVCQANEAGTPYFYFELFDEPWKGQQFGGVEGWWGLFNADRTRKGIKIPNCTAP